MKLPKGWQLLRMEQIGDVKGGRQLNPQNAKGQPHPYLRVANVQDGWIDFRDVKRMPMSDSEILNYELKPGDVLLAEGQSIELVGRPAQYHGEIERCCFQNSLVRLRSRGSCPEFCYYLCSFLYLNGTLQGIAKQTTSMAHLGVDRFAKVSAPVPPLFEQRAIAAILGAWTKGLLSLDGLIAAKERRKMGILKQLLTGRRRLQGFAGKWTTQHLRDLAEEVAIPNRGKLGTERLYAVTKADGMVPMREHVKGASFQRCNLVEKDWFAYNPMRINIGSLARWRGSDSVMVSPDYVVFRCNPARLSPGFLDHLRRTWRWQQFVGMAGDGSVRVRIYFDRLADFTFPCPPLAEQKAIAALLDACDEELRLLRAQRAAVDQQKRGLMQKLLTGRLRARV